MQPLNLSRNATARSGLAMLCSSTIRSLINFGSGKVANCLCPPQQVAKRLTGTLINRCHRHCCMRADAFASTISGMAKAPVRPVVGLNIAAEVPQISDDIAAPQKISAC
jgi:hypothetical protein